MRRAVIALLVAAAAWPGVALGCSPLAGYRVPTGLDLAARADAIVIATVTGERRAEDPWKGAVLTRPIALISGSSLPGAVEIAGAYVAADPRAGGVYPSDPRDLRRVNEGALTGGCVRYVFRPGEQLLLFLARDEAAALVPIRATFARDAEGVSGPDALGVKAVREYAAIAASPRSTWPDKLAARASALRASSDPDAALIATDMATERKLQRAAESAKR